MYFNNNNNNSSSKIGTSSSQLLANKKEQQHQHRPSKQILSRNNVYITTAEVNSGNLSSAQSSHRAVNSSSTGGSKPFLQRILRIQS